MIILHCLGLCQAILLLLGLAASSQDINQDKIRNKLPYGPNLISLTHARQFQLSTNEEDRPILLSTNVLDCKCGTHTTVDNQEAVKPWEEEGIKVLNQYPWSVSLVAPKGEYGFCGGSLISDRYVLTSASCVDGSVSKGVEVLIGTWPNAHIQLHDEDNLNTTLLQRKEVIRIILHPKYEDGHLEYNIALLRLKGPVTNFGTSVTPVCLPTDADANHRPEDKNVSSLLWPFSQDGIIRPKHRTEVEWTLLEQNECRRLAYNEQWEKLPDSMLCAKIEEPAKDHPYHSTFDCPGDAGGPLLASVGNQKMQIGVDSWTACFGKPPGVGLFTRVTSKFATVITMSDANSRDKFCSYGFYVMDCFIYRRRR